MRTKLDKRDDFNFPIVNFLNNIPAAPANGVYISQLIPFFKLCGSYQDFLDRGLLLTRKLGSPLRNIGVTKDHRYFPLVVNTFHSFPYSWFITGFVTRVARRVPLVEQELLTLQEHPSSPPIFSVVCVTRSLILCVCFVDRFCPLSFGHYVVCPSIYEF